MSELERLIQKYCPDGVEYRPLKDVGTVTAGNSAPQLQELYENGKYPFCRTSDIGKVKKSIDFCSISDLLNEEGIKGLKLFPKGSILIPKSGASTLLNNRVRLAVDSYVVSHLAVIIPNEKMINSRFLYYAIESFDMGTLVEDKSYPSVKPTKIADSIVVPVPPLPVQQEIVRILDTFTELTAELIAELDARKKQYEHYRDELLTFGDDVKNPLVSDLIQKYCPDGVEYRPILNVLSQPITDGPHETPMLVDDGVPFLSVAAIHDGIVDVEKCQGYISLEDSEMYRQKYRPMKDDVYMVKSASVGKVAIVGQNVDFDIWSPIAAMRCDVSKMLPRFLFYVLHL